MVDEHIERKRILRVEDMPVCQVFYDLALRVEKATRGFGPDFRWLRNQVLRSSESVPANLTEGFYAQYSTEYLQSLFRCRREGRETMTRLRYAADADVLTRSVAETLLHGYEDGMKQLALLIASVERKIRLRGKGRPGMSGVKEAGVEYLVTKEGMLTEPLTINPPTPRLRRASHQPSTINH